jgi:hypothetical protein
MLIFLESSIAVAAIGLLLVTLTAIIYSQQRTNLSLIGVVLAVLLLIGGVLFERLWLTPTEQVQQAAAGLFDAIEANDLPAVLKRIVPTAVDVRDDAELLMPMFRIQSAGVGGEVRVEMDTNASPPTATAYLKPVIKVQHKKTGTTGAYFDKLEIDFERTGDKWLLKAYRPAKNWRKGAQSL